MHEILFCTLCINTMGKYAGRSSTRRMGGKRGGCVAGSRSYNGKCYSRVPFRPRGRPPTRSGAPLRAGFRVRTRIGSATATYQRRKRQLNQTVKTGENTSASYCTIGSSFSGIAKPLYSKLLGRRQYQTNTSAASTSATGQQGVLQLSNLVLTQLNYIRDQCNGGTTTDNNVRCFIGGLKSTLKIRNQSNDAGVMWIYDLGVKRTPYQASNDTPIEQWDKGTLDMGNANLRLVPGQTPFHSPEFRAHSNVLKVTRVPMEAGQTHEHQFRHYINRVIDSTLWNNGGSTAYRGLTTHQMIVWHGGIGHESTTNTSVTYMPMKLDYIQNLEFSFAYLPQNTPAYAVNDNLAKAVTDFDFMGESGDIDVSNAVA